MARSARPERRDPHFVSPDNFVRLLRVKFDVTYFGGAQPERRLQIDVDPQWVKLAAWEPSGLRNFGLDNVAYQDVVLDGYAAYPATAAFTVRDRLQNDDVDVRGVRHPLHLKVKTESHDGIFRFPDLFVHRVILTYKRLHDDETFKLELPVQSRYEEYNEGYDGSHFGVDTIFWNREICQRFRELQADSEAQVNRPHIVGASGQLKASPASSVDPAAPLSAQPASLSAEGSVLVAELLPTDPGSAARAPGMSDADFERIRPRAVKIESVTGTVTCSLCYHFSNCEWGCTEGTV